MSVARVVRFLIGTVIAAILLVIVLPYVGVPRSHILPPAMVWQKAQGVTRGVVTAKYYDVTGNPFNVGGKEYFVKYQFVAKAPPASGAVIIGKPQVYSGIIRVDQPAYDEIKVTADQQTLNNVHQQTDIPAVPGQIFRVQYEVTYPYINGVIAPAEFTGRNIGEGSNNSSGWILWIVVALFVGYLTMMLLEQFGSKENI